MSEGLEVYILVFFCWGEGMCVTLGKTQFFGMPLPQTHLRVILHVKDQ